MAQIQSRCVCVYVRVRQNEDLLRFVTGFHQHFLFCFLFTFEPSPCSALVILSQLFFARACSLSHLDSFHTILLVSVYNPSLCLFVVKHYVPLWIEGTVVFTLDLGRTAYRIKPIVYT